MVLAATLQGWKRKRWERCMAKLDDGDSGEAELAKVGGFMLIYRGPEIIVDTEEDGQRRSSVAAESVAGWGANTGSGEWVEGGAAEPVAAPDWAGDTVDVRSGEEIRLDGDGVDALRASDALDSLNINHTDHSLMGEEDAIREVDIRQLELADYEYEDPMRYVDMMREEEEFLAQIEAEHSNASFRDTGLGQHDNPEAGSTRAQPTEEGGDATPGRAVGGGQDAHSPQRGVGAGFVPDSDEQASWGLNEDNEWLLLQSIVSHATIDGQLVTQISQYEPQIDSGSATEYGGDHAESDQAQEHDHEPDRGEGNHNEPYDDRPGHEERGHDESNYNGEFQDDENPRDEHQEDENHDSHSGPPWPTYADIYSVVAIARDQDGAIVDIYLKKLHYTRVVAEADATSFFLYEDDIVAHDSSVFKLDGDAVSLTDIIDVDDECTTYINSRPGFGGVCRLVLGSYADCPNPDCNEGELQSYENLRILLRDADRRQDVYSPFTPVCPVCLGKDLAIEQLALRWLLDDNELLDPTPVLEWFGRLHRRRDEEGYRDLTFDEQEWGFSFSQDDEEALRNAGLMREEDGSIWQLPSPEAMAAAAVNQVYAHPAALEAVKNLPRSTIGQLEIDHEDALCLICQEDMNNEETVVKMPCPHVFHEACIEAWLSHQSTCPTCRSALPAAEEDGNDEVPAADTITESTTHRIAGIRSVEDEEAALRDFARDRQAADVAW